jgi:hypothetical protein
MKDYALNLVYIQSIQNLRDIVLAFANDPSPQSENSWW